MPPIQDSRSITRCPRCDVIGLMHADKSSAGKHSCLRCSGQFLERDQVQNVIIDEYGIDARMLNELAEFKGGRRITCPQCDHLSSPFVLRGFGLELCGACGGLWLDHGVILGLADLAAEPSSPHKSKEQVRLAVKASGAKQSQDPPMQPPSDHHLRRPRSGQGSSHLILLLLLTVEILLVFLLWNQTRGTFDKEVYLLLVGGLLTTGLIGFSVQRLRMRNFSKRDSN